MAKMCDNEFCLTRLAALRIEIECCLCSEYMTEKITVCQKGHSVCSSCKQKSKWCPLCKDSTSTERNINLENIASLLTYPCKFYGCNELLNLKTIRQHEKYCEYAPIKCFLNNCSSENNFAMAKYHIREEHFNMIEKWNRIQFSHVYVCVCFFKERVFMVFFEYLPCYVIYSAMYIGPKNEASQYLMKLTFKEPARKGYQLCVTAPCNALCAMDEIFRKNNIITFRSDEMKRFMDPRSRFYSCTATILKKS